MHMSDASAPCGFGRHDTTLFASLKMSSASDRTLLSHLSGCKHSAIRLRVFWCDIRRCSARTIAFTSLASLCLLARASSLALRLCSSYYSVVCRNDLETQLRHAPRKLRRPQS